jgi:uncharacterized coiled-coil protein SlyX
MANGKKVIEEEKLPEPSFLIQATAFVDQKFKDAESIKDPQYGPGLRAFDHKVFIGVMDLQMDHVHNTLVEGFSKKVAEHYDPIMDLLKNLDEGQKLIANDIKNIKERLTITEGKLSIEEQRIEKIEQRLTEKKRRIEKMEIELSMIQPSSIKEYVEEMRKMQPILEWFRKAFVWWKIILYVFGITLLWFLVHYYLLI